VLGIPFGRARGRGIGLLDERVQELIRHHGEVSGHRAAYLTLQLLVLLTRQGPQYSLQLDQIWCHRCFCMVPS
jgi:hypothetical protein